MQIARDTVASIDYRLTDQAGKVLDSSNGKGPLRYVHGHGSLIQGLETELEGKVSGDEFRVEIPPEQAYGARDEAAVVNVERSQLPVDANLEVGAQFQGESEHGRHFFTVVSIDGDRVLMDSNHPLAGATLCFEVKVLEVRAATAEELEHGHPHGPGGHEH